MVAPPWVGSTTGPSRRARTRGLPRRPAPATSATRSWPAPVRSSCRLRQRLTPHEPLPRPPVDRTLAMHVEHLCLWTRPTFLTVNCIPTGVAMNQDERAPFDRASHRARLSAYPWRLRRSGRLHARQRNPGPGGGGPGQTSMASGQRGANGQPGGSAASDGGAPGIGYPPRGAFRHVADRWPLRCAPRRQWEATFTAPTQPGEYAFYCTYHPSMKGTLMSSSQPSGGAETRLTPTVASCPALRR